MNKSEHINESHKCFQVFFFFYRLLSFLLSRINVFLDKYFVATAVAVSLPLLRHNNFELIHSRGYAVDEGFRDFYFCHLLIEMRSVKGHKFVF